MIYRKQYQNIFSRLNDNKAIILLGARQVGKTTLLKKLQKETNKKSVWWNGDEPDIRSTLQNATSTSLQSMIGDAELVIIDEAQRIENIGLLIKLIVDNFPNKKVIATGSSSFELSNKLNEPLTGRKWEFYLYPLSHGELNNEFGVLNEKRLLEKRLIYGSYPEIVKNPGQEKEILNQLADSYLYKDILTWENIHKPAKLEKLIQALAFQVGQQASINELSQITGIDFHTVERYISLLEKAFIVFQLHPFNRNLRNEIKKSRKIYFYDNGILNSVVKRFNPLNLRDDAGALWENYIISERKKKLEYDRIFVNDYFWRNHAQQEIDYIEERESELNAYEFKWNPKTKAKFSKSFINEYSPTITQVIHHENYSEFLNQ